jgi:hypothetical protein
LLDAPAPRQHRNPLHCIEPLDDLACSFAKTVQSALELLSGIAAISEDMAKPGEAPDDFDRHRRRTATVLNVGGLDHGLDDSP